MDQAQQARRPVAELAGITGRILAARERGWVGLIAILLALVIVALLAQKVLTSSGLLNGAEQTNRAGTRLPPAAGQAPSDAASAPATPASAIDRARGLEQQLQRDAQDRAKRIDEQTQ